MKRLWRIPALGLSVAMLALSAGTATAQEEGPVVELRSLRFTPMELVVAPGTTVTWVNFDPFAHSVTADDRSFDSDLLGTNEVFSLTFDAPGTYSYFCVPHGSPGSGMYGTIVVADPAAADEAPAQ